MINKIYTLYTYWKSVTYLSHCYPSSNYTNLTCSFILLLCLFIPSLLRLFFFFVLFVLSSTNLLPVSPAYLCIYFTLSIGHLSSFAGRLCERVIYYQQKRLQNLKPVRVYTFCVQLFTPCITMLAHTSIILSAWFITSRSFGPLRKYGNYNCARLMMRTVLDTRVHFMNNARATLENAIGGVYDSREIVSLDLFIWPFCGLRSFSLNTTICNCYVIQHGHFYGKLHFEW